MAMLKLSSVALCMLGGASAVVLLTYPAFSAPDAQIAPGDRLQNRVTVLEETSQALRKQLDSLERRVEAQQRQIDALQRNSSAASPGKNKSAQERTESDCLEPFYRNDTGQLKVRGECLGGRPSAACRASSSDDNGAKRERGDCQAALDPY